MVWLDSFTLHKRIPTVEKLADVAAKVLFEDELSTRVQFLVAVQVQNEIVKDEQRESSFYSLINLFDRKDHYFILADLCVGSRSSNHHVCFAVSSAIETLTEDDQEAERE